jgi:hypothetical protein
MSIESQRRMSAPPTPESLREIGLFGALSDDVLQYLDDYTATRALANLARLTRGVLYLSALTGRDWRENCDRTRTDRDVHLREAEWYGKRLRRYFRPSGVGFWVRRGSPLTTWEMETAAV